jgi:hypothetical protein
LSKDETQFPLIIQHNQIIDIFQVISKKLGTVLSSLYANISVLVRLKKPSKGFISTASLFSSILTHCQLSDGS